jgi:hypothetical protein
VVGPFCAGTSIGIVSAPVQLTLGI